MHSPDPVDVAKLRDVRIQVQTVPPANGLVVVLFQDELTYYRQPTLARAYDAAGPVQPLARRSDRSNTAPRVVATLDAFTGKSSTIRARSSACRS